MLNGSLKFSKQVVPLSCVCFGHNILSVIMSVIVIILAFFPALFSYFMHVCIDILVGFGYIISTYFIEGMSSLPLSSLLGPP